MLRARSNGRFWATLLPCATVLGQRQRAEFDGSEMIMFDLAAEVHVNAMSTRVCHFVPVCDDE